MAAPNEHARDALARAFAGLVHNQDDGTYAADRALETLAGAGCLVLRPFEVDDLRWLLDLLDEEWRDAGVPQRGSQRDELRSALERLT